MDQSDNPAAEEPEPSPGNSDPCPAGSFPVRPVWPWPSQMSSVNQRRYGDPSDFLQEPRQC